MRELAINEGSAFSVRQKWSSSPKSQFGFSSIPRSQAGPLTLPLYALLCPLLTSRSEATVGKALAWLHAGWELAGQNDSHLQALQKIKPCTNCFTIYSHVKSPCCTPYTWMLFVSNIYIKPEKRNKEKKSFAWPVSASGDLLQNPGAQPGAGSSPQPALPCPSQAPRLPCQGLWLWKCPPQNWPLCVGDTKEQLSCINEKNARVFNLSKLLKDFNCPIERVLISIP